MESLISSYTPTTESLDRMSGFRTIKDYEDIYPTSMSHSIILFHSMYPLNYRIFKSFSDIKALTDNWDEEGAIAPNASVIQMAQAIIWNLETVQQAIYSIAPGPLGEVMLDLRNNNKSAEVLIYPFKIRTVEFEEGKQPRQKDVPIDYIITDLLKWLNS